MKRSRRKKGLNFFEIRIECKRTQFDHGRDFGCKPVLQDECNPWKYQDDHVILQVKEKVQNIIKHSETIQQSVNFFSTSKIDLFLLLFGVIDEKRYSMQHSWRFGNTDCKNRSLEALGVTGDSPIRKSYLILTLFYLDLSLSYIYLTKVT